MRAWPLALALLACGEDAGSPGSRLEDAKPDAEAASDAGEAGPAEDAGRHVIPSADAARNPNGDAGFNVPGAGLRCPPHAPFGTEVGDTLPNVELVDCDGDPYSLHDLCPREVGYVFELSGWCPPCRDFATQADELYRGFRAGAEDRFEMFFVVAENDEGGPADAAFCRTIRDQYGLSMPVLYQPEGLFPEALGIPPNELHIVMGPENRIRWLQHYGGAGVRAALDLAFGE